MAFEKIDETGNEDSGRTFAKMNRMFRSLFAGGGMSAKAEIAALTPVSTADASDPATTQALANANKAKINAIIAALKA